MQNARHVFSFSPDNDSASAGLRADAFVSRHGPVPSATDRPGSGPCTWPRDRAAPSPGHPVWTCSHTGCQLATVHDGHSTITCTLLGNLSWPHSPSQPSTCCGPRAVLVAVPATCSLLVPWAEASLGPCPQHCTALRAAAPMPQAAGPAGILLLLEPLQT